MRLRALGAAALAVLVAAGCGGPKGPTTYTAGGKVVYADGEPLSGGTVQFQPRKSGGPFAVGEIGRDGKFTLYTLVDDKKVKGAFAGTYLAFVIPPVGPDQKGGASVVTPSEDYEVQPKDGNDFTITIPRQR